MRNSIVGLKELRQNMDKYIAEVEKGKSFTVIRRSRPVLKISSPEDDSELWEQVIDFTKIKKGGISAKTILRELRKLNARS